MPKMIVKVNASAWKHAANNLKADRLQERLDLCSKWEQKPWVVLRIKELQEEINSLRT